MATDRLRGKRGDGQKPASTVTVYPSGPLVLRGDFEVLQVDGTTVPTGRIVALCRCGRSAVKPFCDGSHKHGVRPGVIREAAQEGDAKPG
jgi:CDGSH-type Zn-finger protein